MIFAAKSLANPLAVGLVAFGLTGTPPCSPHGGEPACQTPPDQAAAKALRWLCQTMQGKNWNGAAGTLGNTGGKRLAATAIAGLVALASEEDLVAAARMKAWHKKLCATAGGGGFQVAAFANWLDGFGGLYFAERSLRAGKPEPFLRRVVAGLEDRQNPEGGWGHGTMSGSGFYPSTLIAATNWALLALGLGERLGLAVEPEVIDEAMALIAEVQGKNGSVPYGGLPYRKGFEAGRTAGTVMALLALRKEGSAQFRLAAQYVRRNLIAVPNGHASPAMHVFMGALAAHALGKEEWQRYESIVLKRVLAAQREDGSFADIQGQSPDSYRIMADEVTNRAYITALYTAALVVPQLRVSHELAVKNSLPPLAADPELALPASPLWEVPFSNSRAVAQSGDRILALQKNGVVRVFDAASGSARSDADFRLGSCTEIERGRFFRCGDAFYVWAAPKTEFEMPSSMQEMFEKSSKAPEKTVPRERLARYDEKSKQLLWALDLPGSLLGLTHGDNGLYLFLRNGSVYRVDAHGKLMRQPFAASFLKANGAITHLDNGTTVVAGESRIAAFDHEGHELWTRRARAQRGVTPPAFAALVANRESIFAGLSSGEVRRMTPTQGKPRWRVQTGAAVRQLLLVDTPAGQTIVTLTYDGRLHGIRKGKLLWTASLTDHAEAPHPPGLLWIDGSLWAGSAECGRLLEIEPNSGRVLRRLALEEGNHWSVENGRLCIAGKKSLRRFDLR